MELIVVMAIVAILVSFIFVDILGSQRKASISSAVTLLISDLKLAQIRAMGGENGGDDAASPSGIFFDTSSYTIFSGPTFQVTDENNVKVQLESSLILTTNLAGEKLLFASGSGEVDGWATGADSVTIRNLTSNESRTMIINRFGVVTSVN